MGETLTVASCAPLTLAGCTPTPLAGYLKALGVLRLVASADNHVGGRAADPEARGFWKEERFHLETSLGREGLLRFFLEDYAPSPLIGAWNGRAGFLEGEDGEGSTRAGAVLVQALETSAATRLASFRDTIASLRQNEILRRYDLFRAQAKTEKDKERRKLSARRAEAAKDELLPSLRASTDPSHLALVDAAYVIAGEDRPAAPLLGSGFNDGSRDFGVNFAETLQLLFDFATGAPRAAAADELVAALFDDPVQLGSRGTIGQFGPGQGGANASTGFSGENPLRLWDVVLTFEGALVSSGAATRRLGAREEARAAFPFTFEPSAAGSGALSVSDPNRPRGEMWTPLWSKPASLPEVQALFSEGRLTLERRPVRSGLDAARALVGLGVARGIVGFDRYSLVQPDAKMPYQATPLGRFATAAQPRDDLVADLEAGNWLRDARRKARDKTAPAAARAAMRRLEDALFLMSDLARAGEGTRAALEAIGAIALWASASKGAREAMEPPPRLGRAWFRAADDGSPEFRVAAALASLGLAPAGTAAGTAAPGTSTDGTVPVEATGRTVRTAPPMAAHLVPVDERSLGQKRRRWAERSGTQVWSAGPLVANLADISARRLVEASVRGLDEKPFGAVATACLADVAAFLAGPFDDVRSARLLAGLVWARPTQLPSHGGAQPPIAYAALKPLFTTGALLRDALERDGDDLSLPMPPALLARLGAGDVAAAVNIAFARARASGLPVPFAGGAAAFGRPLDGRRLAAALLIPVNAWSLKRLVARAYPPDKDEGDTPEDVSDAA